MYVIGKGLLGKQALSLERVNRNSLLCELEFHLVLVALEMPIWEVVGNEHTCALSSFLGFGK